MLHSLSRHLSPFHMYHLFLLRNLITYILLQDAKRARGGRRQAGRRERHLGVSLEPRPPSIRMQYTVVNISQREMYVRDDCCEINNYVTCCFQL